MKERYEFVRKSKGFGRGWEEGRLCIRCYARFELWSEVGNLSKLQARLAKLGSLGQKTRFSVRFLEAISETASKEMLIEEDLRRSGLSQFQKRSSV